MHLSLVDNVTFFMYKDDAPILFGKLAIIKHILCSYTRIKSIGQHILECAWNTFQSWREKVGASWTWSWLLFKDWSTWKHVLNSNAISDFICKKTMQWDVTCCSQNALSCPVGWPHDHCCETSWLIRLSFSMSYIYMPKCVYCIEAKVSLNDAKCLAGKFASTNNYCSQGMLNHVDCDAKS